MAPLVSSLAQSESKARFFARLGLNANDRVHKRVYNLMKHEAANARKRLLESQSGSTAQIHEAAWQREVMRIYDEACIETKAVYRYGHDTENRSEPDNWIIRWLLWHVFRYRDYRNRGRAPTTPTLSNASSSYGEEDDDDDNDDNDNDGDDNDNVPAVEGEEGAQIPVSHESSATAGERGLGPSPVDAPSPSSQYWDPIRERWQH